MMKAIIGETEQVYFIDEEIINYLNHNMYSGSVLVGVGFKHSQTPIFREVEYDGIKYEWDSISVIPSTNNAQDVENIDKFTPYQVDVLDKLLDGSEICSVSEYVRNEESYQKRLREKKLKRVLKKC